MCDDGVAPYTSLQDAVDGASDGDVVTVCAGDWDSVVVASMALTLRGVDGPDATRIEGDVDHPALTMIGTDAGTLVEGFTLSGDGAAAISVAKLEDAVVEWRDVRVSDVYGNPGTVAVQVTRGAWTAEGVEFSDIVGVDYVVSLQLGEHVVRHSIFRDTTSVGYVVYAFDGPTIEMENNLFLDNVHDGAGYVVYLPDTSASIEVKHNTWYGNDIQADAYVGNNVDFDDNISVALGLNGFYFRGSDADFNLASGANAPFEGNGGESNTIGDPLFVDVATRDVHLAAGSPANDGGNPDGPVDADGSAPDQGAYGGPAGAW